MGLHIVLFRLCAALLRKEVCEINLNTSRRSRSQIVGLRLRFALLELKQLLLDHLYLLFFPLHLDSLLLFLSRCKILLQQVGVVSVSTEDSFVVHDIHGFTTIILVIIPLVCRDHIWIFKLIFATHNFGLGTLKRLSHSFKFITNSNP